MITSGINLKVELDKVEHAEESATERILQQITDVFAKDMFEESNVIKNLKSKVQNQQTIELKSFDKNQVYSIQSIQQLSIKYRLRFLHSSLYKYEFPSEAIFKIKELEKRNDVALKEFFLLAPKEAFELSDINADPLLFAKMSDDKFYLIHHWGNDLNWTRAIKYFPLRGISEFLISVLVFSFLFQMLIPTSVMHIEPGKEVMFRVWLTTHCFIAFFSLFIFLGALGKKGFSNSVWKSKYFNG
jgi:hypothetical protein